jgi:hypothetical protein
VFENRVLQRTFVPKREEVTRGRRKFPNEDLHNLYFLASIIKMNKSRMVRWLGHIAGIGEMRNVYRVLVRNREDKRQLGRHRHRRAENCKIALKGIG